MMLIAGATKSSTAISLLNLVRMRPIGFASKNYMFDRKTLSHIAVCMFEVVLIKTPNIVLSLRKELRMKNKMKSGEQNEEWRTK